MTPAPPDGNGGRPKVLVKEKIAKPGVDLLRERFDVELGLDWDAGELEQRIGEFDAILIRSATKLTADLIEKGERLKAIGRAGTGVDNVDIDAATKRGIIVANAPESNTIAAAEHTIALMLALCRNLPRADASLKEGRWERSQLGGTELHGKTLGVAGFGRIGQLVARRAQAFEMEVLAFDKFVTAERFRELGVEGVDSADELLARSDFVTLHLPKTPETVGFIDVDAIAKMRDGARVVNCARGELVDLDALADGLDSGKLAGAALDVFAEEPPPPHPLFDRDDVVITPHLGASTAEAQDRAGIVTAEQVTAALTNGVVTFAVNIGAIPPAALEALAPFVPLAEKLGRLGQGIAEGPVEKVSVEFRGRLAEHDTRLLGIAVLAGILSGHTDEAVNLVNAPHLAEERGVELTEKADPTREHYTDLITVRVAGGGEGAEVAGTTMGANDEPVLVAAWGEAFYVPFANHLVLLRYTDQPGMIGRVGTIFGEQDVNIISAAVGAESEPERAVMVLTTDAPVKQATIDRILELEGFFLGRAVDL